MRIYMIMLAILLAGCNDEVAETEQTVQARRENYSTYDNCIRAEVFAQCLKGLPGGPQISKYNDWDEVVSECRAAAKEMSLRVRKNIKPECKND